MKFLGEIWAAHWELNLNLIVWNLYLATAVSVSGFLLIIILLHLSLILGSFIIDSFSFIIHSSLIIHYSFIYIIQSLFIHSCRRYKCLLLLSYFHHFEFSNANCIRSFNTFLKVKVKEHKFSLRIIDLYPSPEYFCNHMVPANLSSWMLAFIYWTIPRRGVSNKWIVVFLWRGCMGFR